jgi:hypothetical protein
MRSKKKGRDISKQNKKYSKLRRRRGGGEEGGRGRGREREGEREREIKQPYVKLIGKIIS